MTSSDPDPRPQPTAETEPATQRPGTDPPLVLELVIVGTDPISGTVGRAGDGDRHAFHGWIDLMSLMGSLFAAPDGPATSR